MAPLSRGAGGPAAGTGRAVPGAPGSQGLLELVPCLSPAASELASLRRRWQGTSRGGSIAKERAPSQALGFALRPPKAARSSPPSPGPTPRCSPSTPRATGAERPQEPAVGLCWAQFCFLPGPLLEGSARRGSRRSLSVASSPQPGMSLPGAAIMDLGTESGGIAFPSLLNRSFLTTKRPITSLPGK